MASPNEMLPTLSEKPYQSFADKFFSDAKRYQNRSAVQLDFTRTMSYSQLATLVQIFSYRLHRKGLSRGNKIIISGLQNVEVIISVLATARLGAVAIIVPKVSDEDIQKFDPLLIIAKSANVSTGKIRIEVFPNRFEDITFDEVNFHPSGYKKGSDLACVVGTSGSTGKRKLLSLTAEHLEQNLIDQESLLPGTLQRTLISISTTASFGLKMALVILRQGGCIIWANADDRVKYILDKKIDNIVSAPLAYEHYTSELSARSTRDSSLDFCLVSGGKISKHLADKIRRVLCEKIYVQYGMAELGPIAIGDAKNLAVLSDYSGNLAPWMKAWAISADGKRLESGVVGRLVFQLQAPRRVAPYIDGKNSNPEGIAAEFVSEDFGSIEKDGSVEIKSRISDVVNLGGNKTTLSSIKEKLFELTDNAFAIEVVNIQTELGYDRIAVVVASQPHHFKNYLQAIEKAGVISGNVQIMFVNRFPTNEFGKIDFPELTKAVESAYAQRMGIAAETRED
jgi:fatty-acyl-CoA synthase